MRVFMITDLEGPCGVNGRSDGIGNKIINLETAKQALVNEVNACIEGLVQAGAESVTVVDAHGGSNSIDIFKLHPAAELLQYGGVFHGAFPDDGNYDAAVQIGVHAMQNSGGYMCHSYSSHGISEMRLNGEPIGEIGICTLVCAWFGIPTILVSGDEAACAEARNFIGPMVETVPTKVAHSRYSVRNYSPTKVYAALRENSKRALEKLPLFTVPAIPKDVELVYELMCPNLADGSENQGAERLDFRTVRYKGDDFMRVWLDTQHCDSSVTAHYAKMLSMRKR